MLQSHDYHTPATTSAAMTSTIRSLTTHLVTLARTSRRIAVAVPPEIIEYIENGRNPDVYNREFVEVAQRMNMMLKGKSEAFAMFRDVLAGDIGRVEGMGEAVAGILERVGGGAARMADGV